MIYFQIFTTFRYKSLKNSEYSNGRKSPNRPDSGKATAKGKGVHREVESEGSRRQTVGPMNKNLV